MKFKILFGIFNTIILFSFAAILLLPVFLVGSDYAMLFWGSNWGLILVFLAALAGVNWYFLRNWRLFSCLEREDWNGLKQYLTQTIFDSSRPGKHRVQLLMHAAVLTADMGTIERLETHLAERNPSLVARFAADFSLPHLLSADASRILAFVDTYLPRTSGDTAAWLRFSRGFAHTLNNAPEEAKTVLLACAQDTQNDVVATLASYLTRQLPLSLSGAERDLVSATEERVRTRYSREQWQRMVADESRRLHILAFRGLLNDAESSLFDHA